MCRKVGLGVEQAGEGFLLPQKSEPLEELTRRDDFKPDIGLKEFRSGIQNNDHRLNRRTRWIACLTLEGLSPT